MVSIGTLGTEAPQRNISQGGALISYPEYKYKIFRYHNKDVMYNYKEMVLKVFKIRHHSYDQTIIHIVNDNSEPNKAANTQTTRDTDRKDDTDAEVLPSCSTIQEVDVSSLVSCCGDFLRKVFTKTSKNQ